MDTAVRSTSIKKRAEDMAMELIQGGLVSEDPVLSPVCEKLKPFQEKLGQVDRGLIQKGLSLIEVTDPFGDEEASAKSCLAALVDKLNGMKWLFGI